jgi:hypothetical protein
VELQKDRTHKSAHITQNNAYKATQTIKDTLHNEYNAKKYSCSLGREGLWCCEMLRIPHVIYNSVNSVVTPIRETDHSPPSSAEVKTEVAIPLLPYMFPRHSL